MIISKVKKEMICLKNILKELDKKQVNNAFFKNYQKVVHLVNNQIFYSRKNHIQLKYHFIC